MTVREWFRLQRRELWESGSVLSAIVEDVARRVVEGRFPPDAVPLSHDARVWFNHTALAAHLSRQQVIDQLYADIAYARNRLLYAKDITG